MAKTNPGTTGSSAGRTPFWERLHSLFTNDDQGAGTAGEPRRGVAITISILVSTLLWFTFSMQETYQAIIVMPTEITNLPSDQALRTPPPSSIRAQVEGEGLSLIRLRLNPPTVPINASSGDAIVLQNVVPEVLKNVRVQIVTPTQIDLQKDRRVTRKIPVVLHARITTPPSHDLIAPPYIMPDSVLISGAASVINRIRQWPTQPVVVEELRDSLVVSIPLTDTLSGLVQRSTDTVTLTAVAARFTEGIREIDVIVSGQPSDRKLVRLEPSTIRVRYRVLFSQYEEAMQAPDFLAIISREEILADTTGYVRPHVLLPEKLIIRDVETFPSTLQYYERLD